jgi:hypothetical protein
LGPVGDDPAAPDVLDQIVRADYPPAVNHKIKQQVEDLRFERDQLVPAAQLAPLDIELDIEQMVAEPEPHSRRPTRPALHS